MQNPIRRTTNKCHKQLGLTLTLALLLCLTGLLGSTVFAQPQTIVKLSPSTAAISQGERVDVALRVEGVQNLYGAQVDLYFDPTKLIVKDSDPATAGTQVALGNFLSPDFVVINSVDGQAGTLSLAFTQVSPSLPVEGSGDLATITFEGVGRGSAALKWGQVILADRDGQQIQARLEATEIQIDNEFPTLTLLAGGASILAILVVLIAGGTWIARRQSR